MTMGLPSKINKISGTFISFSPPAIYEAFSDMANLAFGTNINFSNDWGYKALDIGNRIQGRNRQTITKISDSKGKSTRDDPAYLTRLAQVFNVTR